MLSKQYFISINEFVPKTVKLLRSGYSVSLLKKDMFSGFTVGVVALPLAIVFAIGAGASPSQGLWTCIIAGFVCALLGGSNFLVSGPTGALLVLSASILEDYGMQGLFYATLMGGIMAMILGFAGLGKILRFMPYPVTTGFTTGIGFMIAAGQLKDFLGLKIEKYPTEFVSRLVSIWDNIESFYHPAFLTGLATIAIIIAIRHFAPRIPAAVVALALVSIWTWYFELPVPTIGSRFGEIPKGFPSITTYAFNLSVIKSVFPSAVTIALLGSIITVMSAVVADGLSGDRHDSNMELVAQGAGNILASLFGGIPSTGAVARTVVNIKNGAASPISAIVHSIVLLVFTLFLGNVTKIIPLAALSGVLLVVAWDMSDMGRFFSMRYSPKSDLIVMVATFLLAVIIDLSTAVEIGLLLAVILFIKRITETSSITPGLVEQNNIDSDTLAIKSQAELDIPKGVEVYQIQGPFFFGTADLLQEALKQVTKQPRVFILRMRLVPAIDATGLNALESFRKYCDKHDTVLLLSGVRDQPYAALKLHGLIERIGEANMCNGIDEALEKAKEILAADKNAE